MKKFQCLINTESELMIKAKRMWSVINAIKKIITNCNILNWQKSSLKISIRHLWGRCMLKEKTSTHRKPCECKMKSINWCGTEAEHNVLSISAKEVKMEKYWNHSEHWDRDEYHFSVLCYEIEINVHKECEVITIWIN